MVDIRGVTSLYSDQLTVLCSSPPFRYKYQLRAVVEHLGGPTSGHYCTYKQCRREWVYTSDSLVYPMPLHDVLKCQAYMLFYQKIT